jgi:hypothetical protein
MRRPSPSDTAGKTLSLRIDGDILRARLARGADSQSARIACWREIVAAAHGADCRKILLIDRERGSRIGASELAQLALLLRTEASRFDRIAVVEPVRALHTTMCYGETIARALGIPVRLFDDTKHAMKWLREPED